MEYIRFTLLFFLIHTIAYYIAGIINYQFSGKLYGGRDQLYKSFLRNMSDPKEAGGVNKKILPVQMIRAVLMSVVLYPVIGYLGELSFGLRFLFMGGLMFIYADFCSAIPFSNTLEGLIYMKPEYVKSRIFWTIQMEAIIYSILFGLAAGWFLF
jgi:hypothetical protein